MGNIYKLILFILIIATSESIGQNYSKESENLVNHKITASGEKVAFFKNTAESVTMIVKDLKHNKEYSLEGISNRTVLNEEVFIGWNSFKQKLYRINFRSRQVDSVNNVSGFHWHEKLDLLVQYQRKAEKIILTTSSGDVIKVFGNVRLYSLSESMDKLLIFTTDHKIVWFDMVSRKTIEKKDEYLINFRIKRILWSSDERAYILSSNQHNITILNVDEKILNKVVVLKRIDERDGSVIDTLFTKARLLNGYLALGKKEKFYNTLNSPKIWNQFTKDISENKTRQLDNSQNLLLVKVADGSLMDLSEKDKLLDFRIGVHKDMIFFWEIYQHEDFTLEYPLKEVYWYNQHSKIKKNLGFLSEGSIPLFSFDDIPHYFYFKNGDWFLFNVAEQASKNITAGSGGIYYNERFQKLDNSKKMYLSIPATFSNKLIIQEKYDVYVYDYKSTKLKRITNGKETGRRYTVQLEHAEYKVLGWDLNFSRKKVNHNKLLLKWHTEDYSEEGISVVSTDGKIKDIVKDDASFNQLRINGNFISVLKEKANLPPQLLAIDLNSLKTEMIFQSNIWDIAAKDIKVDYLKWKDTEGRLTGALVRFPINYDKNKSYPAVFRIYESKKQNRNTYEDPLILYGTGFNYRDYINDGYFVIEPDILYNEDEPGISALRCVETALNKVIEAYSIDVDRVGICGHSFGGYETNYIVTQTDRFKAAASSAGVFDLESFYLTINWETMKPDMWRMENHQFRMGKGMYENRDAYRKNSPSNFVENVTTPLLLVTGDKDLQVNWQQSVMMFLAMKRLNKEVKLLLYPEEIHSFIKFENKRDFARRIKHWFDYYLKDDVKDLG